MAAERFDCYECEEDECALSEEQSPTCEDAIYCWKSTVREEDGTDRHNRGCVGSLQEMRFTCNNNNKANDRFRIECCREEFCNGGAFPALQPVEPYHESTSAIKLTLAIAAPLLAAIFVALAVLLHYRRSKKHCCSSVKQCAEQRRRKESRSEEIGSEARNEAPQAPGSSNVVGISSYSSPELKVTSAGDSTLKEYLDGQSLTSGSGSGQPLLMQRTFSKQISLVERLNGGKLGGRRESWRGVWQGEDVTVKIYPSRSEMLWARETEVYTQLLPSKHDNILGYIGSDTTSAASCTQLWIVTHYHPNGSLRNYLRERRLECNEMFQVCLSLVHGLLYLHTEINGTKGKASMAHRNLSSKNVFVKNDGTCVIADFGYAVTQGRLEDNNFLECISKRYMSPELLERTFDPQSLESFRQADMYSLGLVLWEICRRCIGSNDVALDYAVPYSEALSDRSKEPTLEEMKKLVVTDQRRPEIPQHWHSDQTLAGMEAMMKECWHTKAAARLPILRVKKTLMKLASGNPDVKLPYD